MIVDLFAGPGGWDEGSRIAGYEGTLVGLEWEKSACETAVAVPPLLAAAALRAVLPR